MVKTGRWFLLVPDVFQISLLLGKRSLLRRQQILGRLDIREGAFNLIRLPTELFVFDGNLLADRAS